jgi:hypothetical protein
VDIAVPIGTKLRTSVGGTAQIGHDARSGLFVRITSPDGKVVSSLAHLSVAHVTNGQQVAPGEVVAFSGASGHATGPHVHWRVKVDGKDVDPLHYTPGQQALTDDAHAEVQAGNQAPALAPPAPHEAAQPILAGGGPSLYDMAGVADKAESDRYRISSALRSEAGDRLQAITNQRKLEGLKATDQLYATFGSKVLTGDISAPTIVATLTQGGYSPQVIAEAINNVRGAVGDTEGLANARLSLSGNQPARAKALFDLATEGRVNGYTPDFEERVGQKVISGDITAQEGIQMVGSAVSAPRRSSRATAHRPTSMRPTHREPSRGPSSRRPRRLGPGWTPSRQPASAPSRQSPARSWPPRRSSITRRSSRRRYSCGLPTIRATSEGPSSSPAIMLPPSFAPCRPKRVMLLHNLRPPLRAETPGDSPWPQVTH